MELLKIFFNISRIFFEELGKFFELILGIDWEGCLWAVIAKHHNVSNLEVVLVQPGQKLGLGIVGVEVTQDSTKPAIFSISKLSITPSSNLGGAPSTLVECFVFS